jgi:hypothetical protein
MHLLLHAQQGNDGGVVHRAQQAQLALHVARQYTLLLQVHVLQGHQAASLPVPCTVHL